MRSRGYLCVVDPTRARAHELDTFTCGHCNHVVLLHDCDGRALADVGVHCHGCDAIVCVPCAEQPRCEPFEQRLAALEARARLLAAAGAE